MSLPASRSATRGGVASRLLVPVLTPGVTIAMLSARAVSILLPAMSEDLHTSVALMGQIPALMLLLAGALALAMLLLTLLAGWSGIGARAPAPADFP